MKRSSVEQHSDIIAHVIDQVTRGKHEDRAARDLCLKFPSMRADFPKTGQHISGSFTVVTYRIVPLNHNISFETMDPCHSKVHVPVTAWYFDSEPDEYYSKSESEKGLSCRQPWRAFWPPKSKRMKLAWLQSEYPEVLTWRFDPTLPFDRPWRVWARSTDAMKEKAITVTPIRSTRKQGQTLIRARQQSCRSDLNDLIENLHLKSVPTGGVSFLAYHDIYHTEKPYLSRLPSGTSLPRTNLITSNHQLDVFDISGHESSFTLAKSGFEYAKSSVRLHQWSDSSVCSEYIPQMEKWLEMYLGCDRAFIYAYNFRGNNPAETGRKSTKTPFFRVHCDATATSCLRRLQLFLPEQASLLSKQRVRFLNIWRPITTLHQDSPLAFCDYRSLNPEKDLVAADIIFPHYRDEAYEVLYNPNQRWFYKKGMDWDDVILFKLGDTKTDEAPLCPHSAFMDPSVPAGTPARRSIEVRAMIIG